MLSSLTPSKQCRLDLDNAKIGLCAQGGCFCSLSQKTAAQLLYQELVKEILRGCASVFSTQSSRDKSSSGPKSSHRYFRVSAIQKDSIPLLCLTGTSFTFCIGAEALVLESSQVSNGLRGGSQSGIQDCGESTRSSSTVTSFTFSLYICHMPCSLTPSLCAKNWRKPTSTVA